MSRYVSVADTAKEVRAALKAAFPYQKFSVRSSSYSGGASIRVNYVDGPAEGDVEAVVGQFKGSTFDGMIDLKSYHDSQYKGETVHWGADHVFVSRTFSAEVEEQAREFVNQALQADGISPDRGYVPTPQAFYRHSDEFLRHEYSVHTLVAMAAAWIVCGRYLSVAAAA